MLAAFDQSDVIALLATLDIPALKNLKLTLETLDLLNYPRERWRVVLNRADSKVGLARQRGREDAQGAHRRRRSRQLARRARLDQPRRADRPRRPEAPGEPGDPAVRRRHVAAGWRRAADDPERACARDRRGPAAQEGQDVMSLADRLAAGAARPRRRERRGSATEALDGATPALRAASRDPFAELKRTVHQTLLDNLGPQLYDSRLTQAELEQKVRHTLQEVLAQDETPLTVADRARIAQEIADDILGYGPLEPFLRDPDITEVMVNGPDSIYVERGGRSARGRRPVHRRGAPAPHDRQDRRAGSAAASTRRARWSTPGCPTAAASTRSSRRWRSTARCSRSASSPPTPTPSTTWSASAR